MEPHGLLLIDSGMPAQLHKDAKVPGLKGNTDILETGLQLQRAHAAERVMADGVRDPPSQPHGPADREATPDRR